MYGYKYDEYEFEDASCDKYGNTKRVSIDKMDASSYDRMNPKLSLSSSVCQHNALLFRISRIFHENDVNICIFMFCTCFANSE